jgi:putative FmdB family regulatory protein
MPIYEYECTACGKIEEVIQHFSDKTLKKCPHCSGRLQKLISQSTFHLKGSGWYVTDYANGANAKASSSEKNQDSAKDSAKEKTTKKTEKAVSKASED